MATRKPKPKVETAELDGMPLPLEEVEITIVGKDTWVGYATRHQNIKVGRGMQLLVVGHVSQVGVREHTDGEDVLFVKIKAESIEETDG